MSSTNLQGPEEDILLFGRFYFHSLICFSCEFRISLAGFVADVNLHCDRLKLRTPGLLLRYTPASSART